MKLGIFTDSHYSSAEITCTNRYNSKSLGKIKKAFKYFRNEKCDLVVCLGDLIDRENEHKKTVCNLKEISRVLDSYDLKTYVVMGNHDGFEFEVDEFYAILGEKHRPQNTYMDNKNLIFMDACYFKTGIHYKPGDSDWTDTFYPETDYLKEVLEKVEGDTYVFVHQSLSPTIREDHRISNDAQIREVMEKSGKVCVVFQGHFHEGEESECNGIRYVTYPAMCENEDCYYVVEI